MEKKTKHRILGILVVIGLVLISLPMLQGGQESSAMNASLVKAPPFPDQAVQVNSAPVEAKIQAPQPSPIPIRDPSQPTDDNNSGMNQQPDDTIKMNAANPTVNPQPPSMTNPSPVKNAALGNKQQQNNMKAQMMDKVVTPDVDTYNSPEGTDYIFKNSAHAEDAVAPAPKPAHVKKANVQQRPRAFKVRPAVVKQPNVDNNGLFKLKNAVWVIQLGSFKNKENALRLVNKLRTSGYRAFIQQASSHTQVFVGPENKQNSARSLKSKIEAELHISGIVVSYKPLKI